MKLLKFRSPTCPACDLLDKALAELGQAVETIDVTQEAMQTRRYLVRSVPVLVAVDDSGDEIDRMVGFSGTHATDRWLMSL